MADDTAPGSRGKPRRRYFDTTCEECGESYQASRSDSRYCSNRCQSRHRYQVGREPARKALCDMVCEECGTTFTAKKKDARFCSRVCNKKAYARENRDAIREVKRQWARDHPEARQAASQRFRDKNPDHDRQQWAAIKADPERLAGRRQQRRQWYATNREVITEQNRQKRIRDPFARRYYLHGGTEWIPLFTSFLEAQDAKCYLCGDPLDFATPRAVALDHDHRCCPKGRTCERCRRGLACTPCNWLIGFAGDNPDRLRRIADNLERANAGVQARMAEAQGVLFWMDQPHSAA